MLLAQVRVQVQVLVPLHRRLASQPPAHPIPPLPPLLAPAPVPVAHPTLPALPAVRPTLLLPCLFGANDGERPIIG